MRRKQARRTRSAMALSYDGKTAPSICAKGNGEIADKILEIAKAHGVPIKKDPALAAALSEIPLGDQVPESLFEAVAQVLAYVYYINDKAILGAQEEEPP